MSPFSRHRAILVKCSQSRGPILYPQPRHSLELALVRGDEQRIAAAAKLNGTLTKNFEFNPFVADPHDPPAGGN